MTAQFAESVLYGGEEVAMLTTPLEDYFAMGGASPLFDANYCTALWRGYAGRWDIVGDRLYLIALQGHLEGGGHASLASVFPEFPERVFAHWYSGELRLVWGKPVRYVHRGFASVYPREQLLGVERGVLVSERTMEREPPC